MFGGPMPDCPATEECVEWIHALLKDCVCSTRDMISFSLGMISVLSWGIAEVPQIITNYREKSTEGVSLAFLTTWVVGDVFNLAGCYLEPATLPTQFYMALLYTFTTVILVLQTIYYDYVYDWFRSKGDYEKIESPQQKVVRAGVESLKRVEEDDSRTPLLKSASESLVSSPPTSVININVPVSRRVSGAGSRGAAGDLFYSSARSLASSHHAPYMVGSRDRDSGSGGGTHGFLRSHVSSSPQNNSVLRSNSVQSGSLLRTVASSVLVVGSMGLTSSWVSRSAVKQPQAGQVFLTGRRLLQVGVGHYPLPMRNFLGEEAGSALGEVFGWCMAAIYMFGRLPQILLNIRRGTVEGLNPLMFFFALVGNATYVASILVRSLLWANLKPNMPWLVDAAVCVLLDLFILCQFIYYTMRNGNEDSASDSEIQKEPLAPANQ